MMVNNRGSVYNLIKWQWRKTLLFVVSAVVVVLSREIPGIIWLDVPAAPMTIVGAALGIFVSFRTNSAYDRWWEGRKLWGRLINTSRHFTTQVLSFLPRDTEVPSALQRTLILRHVAYVNALRVLLRGQSLADDPDIKRTLLAEDGDLMGASNPTHALLHRQQLALTAVANAGELDELRLQSLDETVAKLLDIQGGCERIKKTPLPKGYGFIADRLIVAFGLLFPITLSDELGWWVVPLNVLTGLSFTLISEAGRVLEDPFTMFWNGLPLSQISRMIEVNVRELLGDSDLPEIPGPNKDGILM